MLLEQQVEGFGQQCGLALVLAHGDTDPTRNETFISAAGRMIRVPQALDEIMGLIAPSEGLAGEGGEERWPF